MKVNDWTKVVASICLVMLMSACSSMKSVPPLPVQPNQSAGALTDVNGLELYLPLGWISLPLSEVDKEAKVKAKIKDVLTNSSIIVYGLPSMAADSVKKYFRDSIRVATFQDSTKAFGTYSYSSALIDGYKGSLVVEGERMEADIYEAYGMESGFTSYYLFGMAFRGKDKFYHDFVNVAGSL